jgi:hypothetical protein
MIPAGLRPASRLRWPDQRDDAPAWKQESMLTGYVVLRNKAGGGKDGLTVMAQTSSPETGLAVADAEFTGIGRDDDPRRFKTQTRETMRPPGSKNQCSRDTLCYGIRLVVAKMIVSKTPQSVYPMCEATT